MRHGIILSRRFYQECPQLTRERFVVGSKAHTERLRFNYILGESEGSFYECRRSLTAARVVMCTR